MVERKSFFDKIGTITHLHLLPTSIGSLRKLSAQIIHFRNVNQASIDAWGLLGVYPVHPEIVSDAGLISCLIQQSLAHIPRTSGYIVFLMRSCDSARQPQLSQGALASIRDSLLSGLPQDSRVELLPDEIKKLLSLRIFMVRKVEGSRGLSAATGNRVFTNTDDDHPLPFLPDMQNVIYVDWKDSVTKALIGLVDFAVKVHDHFDLLQLAIDNWGIQSNERQDVWVEKFLDNWRKLPHHLRSKLEGLPLSPSSLISLYTGEVGKIPVGRFSNSDYLTIMQNLGFVRFSLDEFVVAERLAYLHSAAH
ncbi:hypothetical protein BDZ97DRAFT_974471 [Flammula alnicola]|nr:hypothetical protein BDZ97DRAFT_974471 [Flammula alnicola]